MTQKNRGWFKEYHRHSLAAQGIPSSRYLVRKSSRIRAAQTGRFGTEQPKMKVRDKSPEELIAEELQFKGRSEDYKRVRSMREALDEKREVFAPVKEKYDEARELRKKITDAKERYEDTGDEKYEEQIEGLEKELNALNAPKYKEVLSESKKITELRRKIEGPEGLGLRSGLHPARSSSGSVVVGGSRQRRIGVAALQEMQEKLGKSSVRKFLENEQQLSRNVDIINFEVASGRMTKDRGKDLKGKMESQFRETNAEALKFTKGSVSASKGAPEKQPEVRRETMEQKGERKFQEVRMKEQTRALAKEKADETKVKKDAEEQPFEE